MRVLVLWFLAFVLFASLSSAVAQQTVFNVPSGDVLDRGKVYGELDATYKHSDSSATFTPRVVVGIGQRIEVGLNLNGFGFPGAQQVTPSPTLKWKIYDGKQNGWAWLVGDDLFFPLTNSSYNAGNYVWTEFTRTWKAGTRATFGAFQFTQNVVASNRKVGGQFALEQPVGSHVTLATDWFTGDHSLGSVTPGIIVKVTQKITCYVTYQIRNRKADDGNNQLLLELGYNFN
jgi:hypothetical protein